MNQSRNRRDKGRFRTFIRRIPPRPITLPKDDPDYWRAVFIRSASLIMSVLMLGYGVFNLGTGSYIFAAAEFFLVIAMFYVGYRLDDRACVLRAKVVFTVSAFVLMAIVFLLEPPRNYSLIWVACVAAIISFLFGTKKGLKVNLLFLAMLICLFTAKPRQVISLYEIFSFSWAMLILFIVMYRYEASREASLRALQDNEEQLYRLSITDGLTRLYNRLFIEQLMHEKFIQAAARSAEEPAEWRLIILDIDNFKSINDTYGHLQGDKILKKFARTLSASVGSKGTAARWGGDEFFVSLFDMTHDEAVKAAENLRKAVEAMPRDDAEPVITISMGIAAYRPSDDYDTFMKRADECMYAAKKQGGNMTVSEEDIPAL